MAKTCGECQLCCFILHVEALKKQEWEQCEHQCKQGCAIYPNRPEICSNYRCLWLSDEFIPEEFRPDKIGCVVDIHDTLIGPVVVCHQIKDGQWKETATFQYIAELAKRTGYWIYTTCKTKREAVFPKWAADQQKQFDAMIKDRSLVEPVMGRMH